MSKLLRYSYALALAIRIKWFAFSLSLLGFSSSLSPFSLLLPRSANKQWTRLWLPETGLKRQEKSAYFVFNQNVQWPVTRKCRVFGRVKECPGTQWLRVERACMCAFLIGRLYRRVCVARWLLQQLQLSGFAEFSRSSCGSGNRTSPPRGLGAHSNNTPVMSRTHAPFIQNPAPDWSSVAISLHTPPASTRSVKRSVVCCLGYIRRHGAKGGGSGRFVFRLCWCGLFRRPWLVESNTVERLLEDLVEGRRSAQARPKRSTAVFSRGVSDFFYMSIWVTTRPTSKYPSRHSNRLPLILACASNQNKADLQSSYSMFGELVTALLGTLYSLKTVKSFKTNDTVCFVADIL